MGTQLSFRQRIALKLESAFMARVVPKDRVGKVLGVLFKGPLVLRRLGLGGLIPKNVLILTTKGRRTGLPRSTPMEFSQGPEEDVYLVMSGWGGHTDWYRNVSAEPKVKVWMGGRAWDAIAERVPDEEVARLIRELADAEPSAVNMWSRWSPVPIDGSEASYLAAAPHFPSFYLRSARGEAT